MLTSVELLRCTAYIDTVVNFWAPPIFQGEGALAQINYQRDQLQHTVRSYVSGQLTGVISVKMRCRTTQQQTQCPNLKSGQYLCQTIKNRPLSYPCSQSFQWMKHSELKGKTESLIIAAQDQVVTTLKADRPHPSGYLHTPTDYGQTPQHR